MNKWRVPNYILGVYGEESYVYRGKSSFGRCTFINFYLLLIGTIFVGIFATELDLWIFGLTTRIATLALLVLSLCIWAVLFRVCFFYQDRVVVFFPLRPYRRTEAFFYTDIESFTWESGDKNVLRINLKEGSRRRKQYVHQWCTASTFYWTSKRRRRFYFLLKFLYDRGCPITFKAKDESEVTRRFARRVNAMFAPEESRPSRPRHATPEEDKLEREAGIFIIAICAVMIVLFVLFVTYLERR
jgi:hypothetical protein